MCVKTDGDNEFDLAVDKDQQIFVLKREVNFFGEELERYKKALRRACEYIDSLGGGCGVCEHVGIPCTLMLERNCVGNIERFFLDENRELRIMFKTEEMPKNE